MGEATSVFFGPQFNRSLRLRSRDDRLTSDAGVLLLREVDERLGLTASLGERLHDPRNEASVRYSLAELIRERTYAFAQGYSAADDCDRVAHDPAFRMAVTEGKGAGPLDERLASQPTHSRLLQVLAGDENRAVLDEALSDCTAKHQRVSSKAIPERATIDVDGFPIEVHGRQEGAAYSGYYGKTVYSPLVASFAPEGGYDGEQLGDGFIGVMLRRGNAAPHEDALGFIRKVHGRSAKRAKIVDVRIDAGFTVGAVLDGLSDDGIRFLGRLKTNTALDGLARAHVTRPVGRPPAEGYEYTVELGMYKARPWRHEQRLVLCVVDKPDPKTGQLYLAPHAFFLVTSWPEDEMSGDELLEHYRDRGTFEDRLSEVASAIAPRLSSPSLASNETTLLLGLLAFNLANIIRSELEAIGPQGWDLRRVQNTILKAGARFIVSGRRVIVDVARAVVPLWEALLARIVRWARPPGSPLKTPRTRRRRPPAPPHAHTSLVFAR